MKNIFSVLLLFFTCFSISQEQLVSQTINKNIKMLTPTTLIKVNGSQVLGKFGNDFAPKAAFVGAGERTVLTVTEIYDTVGFYQPGYAKKKSIARDVTIEKSFYRSSILAYAKEVDFLQDDIKTINKRNFIVFEVEGTQELKNTKGGPVEKKFYRYLQYCFVKDRKYIFNFSCPYSDRGYWKEPIRKIMESVKITK